MFKGIYLWLKLVFGLFVWKSLIPGFLNSTAVNLKLSEKPERDLKCVLLRQDIKCCGKLDKRCDKIFNFHFFSTIF